jgi:hypothetical protein
MSPPLSQNYNLGRLGHAGDTAHIEADEAQRAAIAVLAEALSVSRFIADVTLSKLGPTSYRLAYRLEADIAQACVVTLEPVAAAIRHDFVRELHFTGPARRAPANAPAAAELDLSDQMAPDADEAPEEIESLHYDLAGPALEEFILALDSYPRAPGVEFAPGESSDPPPESPFAVLKSLKSKT